MHIHAHTHTHTHTHILVESYSVSGDLCFVVSGWILRAKCKHCAWIIHYLLTFRSAEEPEKRGPWTCKPLPACLFVLKRMHQHR
ncbi:hypothetical protein JMJ77_0002530, partial [Colletotrichum scovillei]